jgi:hypothetical protein
MKKPKLPEIEPVQVELFAKGLIIAMLNTGADTMTITEKGFNKEEYTFGDFEVKVTQIK